MTTKRFTTVYDEQSKMMQYVDNQKEERWAIWNANKTLQIMNELATNCSSLKNENEQLKQHIQTLQKQTKRLENDNIQTYTLIKEAYETERTSLGKSVLKQLLEAIQ
jgi:predicted transcriptional regulator